MKIQRFRPSHVRAARWFLIALFACELFAILWFALFGEQAQAQLQGWMGINDLAMHMIAFLIASTTAFIIWSPQQPALFLILAAGGIEIAQLFLPDRQPSLVDFTASGLGIVAGVITYLVWRRLGGPIILAPRRG
ncbi:VanZ family protein [Aminobacter lissarensis]|uniref:VanZ family protein n=1 Tax=Aminobacter carboxidus TaxID=376165 RepID=A0A8E2BGA8_9HYPH|nr:hypothetical protein [Aminobacter lissarensis]MBB6469927.1 VanZ family protein [Aminobacter lissarensis]